MTRKVSPEKLQEVTDFYLSNNLTIKEVLKIYTIPYSTFIKFLKRTGQNKTKRETQNKRRKINIEDHENIVEEYLQTKNYFQIAKNYNVSAPTILRILKFKKVTLELKSCITLLSKEAQADIIKMYNSNCLVKDITIKYNLSKPVLRRWLQKNNVKLRSVGQIQSVESLKQYSRGICGSYKTHYFRSLPELSFIHNILMSKYQDSEWRSGENNEDRILYLDENNKERWYYPDFIIKNKIIVECKPKRLWEGDVNKAKFQAARKYCKLNNKKFIVIDPKVDLKLVAQLYKNNELILTEKQELRLKNKISKYTTK